MGKVSINHSRWFKTHLYTCTGLTSFIYLFRFSPQQTKAEVRTGRLTPLPCVRPGSRPFSFRSCAGVGACAGLRLRVRNARRLILQRGVVWPHAACPNKTPGVRRPACEYVYVYIYMYLFCLTTTLEHIDFYIIGYWTSNVHI